MKPIQIEIDGVSHTISEWAKISGLPYQTIYERYSKGDKDLLRPLKTEMLVEINGELHTFKEWAEITGIDVSVIKQRYKKQKKIGDELISAVRERNMEIEVNGESHTLKEWAKITGISYQVLAGRYRCGVTAAEFLKPVKRKDDRQ